MKKTIVLDFDGVIHSYVSGWKGAREIPDPPVEGALEYLSRLLLIFDVCILSSRSHRWGGRRAMKAWLRRHLIELGDNDYHRVPKWWRDRIVEEAAMEPWYETVEAAADRMVSQIRWPLFKPPAHVTIDDRALTFRGRWPDLLTLHDFKPWTKAAEKPPSPRQPRLPKLYVVEPQAISLDLFQAEWSKDAAHYAGSKWGKP